MSKTLATSLNSVFAGSYASLNAFGTSQTRKPLSKIPAAALKRFKTENEIK